MEENNDSVDYRKKILELYNSQEYLRLTAYYSKKTVFDIFDVTRNERVHSSFLAWLFNSGENHGYSIFPVQKFLQLLVMARRSYACNFRVKIDDGSLDSFLLGAKKIKSVTSRREQSTKNGFIDILLEVSFESSGKILPVIIENKVKTDEHPNGEGASQTDRYYEWAEETYKDREKFERPLYVFLSPKYNLKKLGEENRKDVCKNDNFILISYQDIVEYVLEPCLKRGGEQYAVSLINDYMRCLSYSDISKIKDGDLIMAIGTEEKELLRQFWTENEELLLAALNVVREGSDDLNKTYEGLLNHTKKDRTQYTFKGQKYGKGRLVLAVVQDYVKKHPECTLDELKRTIPTKIQGSCGVYEDINKIAPEHDRYYYSDQLIDLSDGTTIAVCNQWAINNIEGFIGHVNETLGPDYKIEESE